MSITRRLFLFIMALPFVMVHAQVEDYEGIIFTEADTLRGSLLEARSCYDVEHYLLDVEVNVEERNISGLVEMSFKAIRDFDRLQFDLYANMKIDEVKWQGKILNYERKHDAVFVDFPSSIAAGTGEMISIKYHGSPRKAIMPPWDGGFVWKKDDEGRPWIGVACEGDGASLWWPNKDHLSDEPSSMDIKLTAPKELTCVANGQLIDVSKKNKSLKTWHWKVSYPINNYNVTLNIAHYKNFKDTYTSFDGEELELDYYVLDYNLDKAKKHFKQVDKTLEAFEFYFDKYPFWEDGFALVETSYLGMEHQGAIAYGNKYRRGYLGGMIPSHMNWDYIIVHETGHEYWGNSISMNDMAEMWIHESFTTYMEALYVEYNYSYEEAVDYLGMQRPYIENRKPIIGPRDVNFQEFGSSDHYYKGSWVLHTLRNVLGDDELWFGILKSFYREHSISNIDTKDFINYFNEKTGKDYSYFFEQYLYKARPPKLLYKMEEKGDDLVVHYRWDDATGNFPMSIKMGNPKLYKKITPSTEIKSMYFKDLLPDDFQVAEEMYLLKTAPLNMTGGGRKRF